MHQHLTAGKGLKSKKQLLQPSKRIFNYITSRVFYFEIGVNSGFSSQSLPRFRNMFQNMVSDKIF
jgi:hypothetical protein